MNWDDFIIGMKYLYGPLAGFLGLVSGLYVWVVKRRGKAMPSGAMSFVIAFGFLGSVSGMIAGVSQQPIVSALLTGLLGICSGLLVYLLGAESLKEWRPSIPIAIIYLMIGTLAGLSLGGTYKYKRVENEKIYTRRLMLYEKVDLEVCKQQRLRMLEGKAPPDGYQDVSCPKK